MEYAPLASFLSLGLGLGILHAFDPDHLAAVGGLSAGHNSHHKTWRFALEWSLGHGSALLAIALSVLLLGAAIPTVLSHFAEQSVAFILIVIGSLSLFRLYRGHLHNSTGLAAPVVGVIHGTAGSAPLLALIPISQISQPLIGVWYVLCFSAGVIMAMTFIGSALSFSLRYLIRQYAPLVGVIQILLAVFSIFLGVYLMLVA